MIHKHYRSLLRVGAFVCLSQSASLVATAASSPSFGIQPPEVLAWKAEDRRTAEERAERLRADLETAIESGASRFTIPKAHYVIAEPFRFENLEGMHIDGSGATFWTRASGKVEFANCRDLLVDNLIIDRLQYPFIQGVVSRIEEGVAPRGGDRIVIELEEGSMPKSAKGGIGRTLCVRADDGRYYYRPQGHSPVNDPEAGPREWIWHTDPSQVIDQEPGMAVGDRVAMHVFVPGAAGLDVLDCGNIHFRDISVYSGSGFLVKESGIRAPGGNRYTRLKIIPRPESSRVATSVKDGFHSYNQGVGPTLVDCEIAATYDDGINIHGFMSPVLEKTGSRELILCAQFGRDFHVGTTLRFHDAPSMQPLGEATVTAYEPVPETAAARLMAEAVKTYRDAHNTKIRSSGRWMEYYRVTFDRPVAAGALDMAVSSEYCGRGARISNLLMRDGCNRGALIKAPGAIIENSRFENVFFGGLYVTGELGPIEGDFADDIVIRDNRFSRCAWYSALREDRLWSSIAPLTVLASVGPKPVNAYFKVSPHRFFSDLRICGNVIEDSPTIALFVANAENALIEDNHIVRPLDEPWQLRQLDLTKTEHLNREESPNWAVETTALAAAADPYYAIYVASSTQIWLENNLVESLPENAKGPLGFGPWNEEISVREYPDLQNP